MKRTNMNSKNAVRQVRHARVRARISGTSDKPRLSVFRGLRNLNAQLIDDTTGKVLCQANTREIKEAAAEGRTAKVAKAYLVGKQLAERATGLKIKKVVFDRGGYKYHGRVQAVADGARDGGLEL